MEKAKRSKLIPILEGIAFLLIIFLFDIFKNLQLYKSWIFNPYWIPLFLAAARYGFLNFLVLSLAYIALSNISMRIQMLQFVNVYFLQFVGVMMGMVLAVIGESFKSKIEMLKLDLEEKDRLIKIRDRSIENLVKENQILRDRLFLEGEGISILIEKLSNLEVLDPEETITRAVDVISEFFSIESLSIYKYEKGFLRFVVGKGKKFLPNSIKEDDYKVIKMALKEGSATIKDVLLKENIDSYEPWLAILIGDKYGYYGVFVVEEINPEKLTPSYIQYLKSIMSWLYVNLKNSMSYSKLVHTKHRKENGTWSNEYYNEMKKKYENRWKKFGIPYSEIQVWVSKKVFDRFVKFFRKEDIITVLENDEKGFIVKILLAVCDEMGKERVYERLKKEFGNNVKIIENY